LRYLLAQKRLTTIAEFPERDSRDVDPMNNAAGHVTAAAAAAAGSIYRHQRVIIGDYIVIIMLTNSNLGIHS